jgi:hypothetical protein
VNLFAPSNVIYAFGGRNREEQEALKQVDEIQNGQNVTQSNQRRSTQQIHQREGRLAAERGKHRKA